MAILPGEFNSSRSKYFPSLSRQTTIRTLSDYPQTSDTPGADTTWSTLANKPSSDASNNTPEYKFMLLAPANTPFNCPRPQVSAIARTCHGRTLSSCAIAMGGNVRVGLEDSLWSGAGRLARSNAEQVRAVRTIIEAMGCDVATPDEARALLHLKGANRTSI